MFAVRWDTSTFIHLLMPTIILANSVTITDWTNVAIGDPSNGFVSAALSVYFLLLARKLWITQVINQISTNYLRIVDHGLKLLNKYIYVEKYLYFIVPMEKMKPDNPMMLKIITNVVSYLFTFCSKFDYKSNVRKYNFLFMIIIFMG